MWSEIVKSFSDLTPILWVSQIAGLIGLFVIGISYMFKKKIFILLAAIAMVFFVIEQVFASLYSNLIVTSSCLIRNVIMVYLLWKKNKEVHMWGLVTICLVMWAVIFTYLGVSHGFAKWDNYLPPLLMTLTTFTQNNKNEYVVKTGATFQEFGFMVYYIIYRLPFSVLRQAILVVACIVGIIVLLVKHFKNKKENREANESIS